MSDTYIPELMELNSYWQNAVEEAIQDTLKGEKRLYYALKNRKKIKKKLEKLGVEPEAPNSSFDEQKICSSEGECFESEYSDYHNSCNSFEKVVTDPGKSQTRSRTHEETPQRKVRNPDRPLLGDGSMEKMTKSQNSFNYEPMGMQGFVKMEMPMSESEIEDEDMSDHETKKPKKEPKKERVDERKSKTNEKNYEDKTNVPKKMMQEKLVQRKNSDKSSGSLRKRNQTVPINLDPSGDLFWENEVKNAIRVNSKYERKLQLALAKREILSQRRMNLVPKDVENKITVEESEAKHADRRTRGKKFLSPFVRFYLDVYRELCQKFPAKQISKEAAKRWWGMSMKQKFRYSSRKPKK